MEYKKLSDKNNYKIFIQQKFNRKDRRKAKYLTPDFAFSENINQALEFENFQDAENILPLLKHEKIKSRIIIKYFDNTVGE